MPILRNKTDDAEILDYCDRLATELRASSFADEPIRVLVDRRDAKSVDKRWTWIKRGAPVICEIGGRDILHEGSVIFLRRDKLRDGNRLVTHKASRQRFVGDASKLLQEIQDALYVEAKDRVARSIITHPKTIMDVYQYFDIAAETSEPDGSLPARGWVRASWKRPQGTESQQIEAALKERNLTIRNAPLGQNPPFGQCIFTGSPADEEILIARAY